MYEPNSWSAAAARGPRTRLPQRRGRGDGTEGARRGELFADHYSQARQFYLSQQPVEQTHIRNAFVFELSKVERPEIRARVVSHLRNVDEDLAAAVADRLGLDLPSAAKPARPVVEGLAPSPKLSILGNGPERFEGRKLGVLVTDGTSAKTLASLQKAMTAAGAMVELVAPKIGGVTLDDGSLAAVHHRVDGGPSVLFDAVALLPSEKGASMLAGEAAVRDFIADAYAHAKFIACSDTAAPLLAKAGVERDGGIFDIDAKGVDAFVSACAGLRFWEREAKVHA